MYIVRELEFDLSGCRRCWKLLNKGLICFYGRHRLTVQLTKTCMSLICLKPRTGDGKSIKGSKKASWFQQISSSPKGLNKFLSLKSFQQLCWVNHVSMAESFGVWQQSSLLCSRMGAFKCTTLLSPTTFLVI